MERYVTDTIMERYERLSQYLGLDIRDLEKEFIRVPRIQQEAAELAAAAAQVVEYAKYNIRVAEAEAAARIREIPVHGKEPSQARIDSMLPLDPEVQAAHKALIVATNEAVHCSGLAKSFDSQSWLLRKASDLASTGYFQPPWQIDQRRQELRDANAERNRQRREGDVRPHS